MAKALDQTRHIVLLRGINVGGKNKLPMADLRGALETAGYADVSTYIQSGNVALSAGSNDGGVASSINSSVNNAANNAAMSAAIGETISEVIKTEFGLTIPVVVRSAEQLRSAIENNPFPEMVETPKFLHLYFCQEPISEEAAAALDHDRYVPDRMVAGETEVYVSYRDGVAGSKLTNAALDKALGQATTARNWNTVMKLLDMAEATI